MSTHASKPGCYQPRDWAFLRSLARPWPGVRPFLLEEPCQVPLSKDKTPFASPHRIISLFDPRPYAPTLADDLGSFTQVFIVTFFGQRKKACARGDLPYLPQFFSGTFVEPELPLYWNAFESELATLRDQRMFQGERVRDVIAAYAGASGKPEEQTPAWDDRFGDMVSLGEALCSVLQVSWDLGERNRQKAKPMLPKGCLLKARDEYEDYMRVFAVLGEDYVVSQKRKGPMDREELEAMVVRWRRQVVPGDGALLDLEWVIRLAEKMMAGAASRGSRSTGRVRRVQWHSARTRPPPRPSGERLMRMDKVRARKSASDGLQATAKEQRPVANPSRVLRYSPSERRETNICLHRWLLTGIAVCRALPQLGSSMCT
ncbi:hypothetical protein C8T65DRAFT_235913 [Cerioporus squamosus]|nr:hypothetical protein C8T65DRAFT_235913 [Cerioporus squamosus]